MELTQRAWIGYKTLQRIKDQAGNKRLSVRILRNPPGNRPEDTEHFFNSLLKDYNFNWWIDSLMVAALDPPNWRLRPSELTSPPEPPVLRQPPVEQPSGLIRRMMRNFKYLLGYTDILSIRWSGLLLAVYVNLLPKSPSRMRFEPDKNFRPEPYFPRPFLKVLEQLIDATMPNNLLDGFPKLAEKAKRLPYVPGRLRLGALSFWNEQEKVIAAFAKEAGEKRVVFQHGGEYGMVKYLIMVNEVELRSTIFVSWGWAYDTPTGDHVLPLPSPHHSKIANRHKRRNNSIIVVGQTIRIHLNRLHWCYRSSIPLWYCKEYFLVGFHLLSQV